MSGMLIRCLVGLVGSLLSLSVMAEYAGVEVVRERFQESVRLDGVVEATRQSTMSAQTAGRVLQLPFDVDDRVAAGELIVQLEDSEQQARHDQARAAADEANTSLKDAQQRFARAKAIHDRRLSSQQDFDQASNAVSSAQARVARAEAALAESYEQLKYTQVRAPYSGILTARHVEVGESVSVGQALLSGLSLEQLRVVVELPQRYAEIARSEQRAWIRLADGRTLDAGNMTFYPYASATAHTFRIRIDLAAPDADLYPGMLVRVDVPVSSREALWIPADTLFRHGELTAVFVLDDQNQPRLRQIRTGVIRDSRVEVLAGLDAGERVALSPGEVFVGRAAAHEEATP